MTATELEEFSRGIETFGLRLSLPSRPRSMTIETRHTPRRTSQVARCA